VDGTSRNMFQLVQFGKNFVLCHATKKILCCAKNKERLSFEIKEFVYEYDVSLSGIPAFYTEINESTNCLNKNNQSYITHQLTPSKVYLIFKIKYFTH
jgi:hypothetical protein